MHISNISSNPNWKREAPLKAVDKLGAVDKRQVSCRDAGFGAHRIRRLRTTDRAVGESSEHTACASAALIRLDGSGREVALRAPDGAGACDLAIDRAPLVGLGAGVRTASASKFRGWCACPAACFRLIAGVIEQLPPETTWNLGARAMIRTCG